MHPILRIQDLKGKEHTCKKVKQNKFKIRVGKKIRKGEQVNSKHRQPNTERRQKCFIAHWPYHKFCRWAKAKKKKTEVSSETISIFRGSSQAHQ